MLDKAVNTDNIIHIRDGGYMAKRVVVNRFAELLAAKARREGRGKISRGEVSQATGLAMATIDTYARNEVTRFDAQVIKALCDYFECEPGDLLVLEEVDEPSSEPFDLVPT